MTKLISDTQMAIHLVKEGLIPDACENVRIEIGMDTVVRVHYTVQMTADRLERFQRAFRACLDDKA